MRFAFSSELMLNHTLESIWFKVINFLRKNSKNLNKKITFKIKMKTNNKNNFQNRIKFKKWYNNNNDKLNDCLLYFYRKFFYDFNK